MKMHTLVALVACLSLFVLSLGELVALEGANFELTLESNKYVAVLFYDDSAKGSQLDSVWDRVSELATVHKDSEIAKIDGNDPDLVEIIELYQISVPSVKVFRRGIMAEYQGPNLLEKGDLDDVSAKVAEFIKRDSQPSVQHLESFDDVKGLLSGDSSTSIVLGFFEESALEESDEGEMYSVSSWGQYQATADALRGHAVFHVITDPAVRAGFNIQEDAALPIIYLVAESGESLVPYKGEILERNLSEWLLRFSSPALGELSLKDGTGELYATQFFSSRKLKFILFLDQEGENGDILASWAIIAETYKGKAIFSYIMRDSIQDVNDFFGISKDAKLPIICAHDPSKDQRYLSNSDGEVEDTSGLLSFVDGVLTGKIEKIIRSESVPATTTTLSAKEQEKERAKPVKLVGSNVLKSIAGSDQDVLLLVHQGDKGYYKFRAEYEILARACAAEPRVLIARLDLSKNDIPSSWESSVRSGADWGVMWFPVNSRAEHRDDGNLVPKPKPYWAAGYTLPELVWFVQREGSFEASSLKIATSEQLNMLMDDLEPLQMTYLEEQRWEGLNDNRPVYEDVWTDWLMGELVFEGKRWHIIAVALCVLVSTLQSLYALVKGGSEVEKKRANAKKIADAKKKA